MKGKVPSTERMTNKELKAYIEVNPKTKKFLAWAAESRLNVLRKKISRKSSLDDRGFSL